MGVLGVISALFRLDVFGGVNCVAGELELAGMTEGSMKERETDRQTEEK